MSLNGLDAAKVTKAHKTVLAESKGWFLLSYSSRDEVEIFQQGSTDLRSLSTALSQYDIQSPLYGFIVFRERKVVVKYLPEGTSRLLQARTSVHWQTVIDRFSPHDAIFTASKPDDVTVDALFAACSMPAVDPSPKSSSSSPRNIKSKPKQVERSSLAPEAFQTPFSSDLPRAKPNKITSPTSERPPRTGSSKTTDDGIHLESEDDSVLLGLPQSRQRRDQDDVIGLRDFLTKVTPPASLHRPETSQTGPLSSEQSHEFPRYAEDIRPMSSHSSRPSTSDIWRSFKPKVKLFPRPVPEDQAHSSQRVTDDVRQRLPAGLRSKARTSESDRPKSRKGDKQRSIPSTDARRSSSSRRDTSHRSRHGVHHAEPKKKAARNDNAAYVGEEVTATTPSSPALKALPPMPLHSRSTSGYSNGRQPAGLGIDVEQSRTIVPSKGQPDLMSPEKQRLMKAMEMRKKQLKTTQGSTLTNNDRTENRFLVGTPPSTATGKIDSAVGMDSLSLEERDRSMPLRQQSNDTDSSAVNSPWTPRRPNPALQSHPVRADDACFFHASQDRRKPPPLPPPPKDLYSTPTSKQIPGQGTSEASSLREFSPPPPPKDTPSKAASEVGSARNSSPVPTPKDHLREPSSPQSSARERSPPYLAKDVVSEPVQLGKSSVQRSTSPPVVEQEQSRRAKAAGQRDVGIYHKSDFGEEQSAGKVEDHTDNADDDALIHELENAKLEEAKMVVPTVSPNRRPSNLSGVSPSASSVMAGPWPGRTAASPAMKTTARRIPPPLQSSSPAESIPVARKVNVSSGISRRIQALAERSNDSRPSSSQGPGSPGSVNSSFLAPGALPSYGRSNRTSVASSFEDSRDASPMMSPRKAFYRTFSSDSARTDDGRSVSRKRDTLSITAHIQPSERTYSGHSLTIEEEGPSGEDDFVNQQPPVKKQATSRTSFARSERPPSPVSNRPASRASTITNNLTRTSLDVWRSMGGGKKSDRGHKTPTSISNTSLDRVDERIERRSSRPNNLLKRMSGLSAGTRKSSHSGASRSSVIADPTSPIVSSKPAASIVGDLNVQFPDSLLWKRRWVEVDANGNLVLSPSNDTIRQTRNGPSFQSKKYHLSGFRPPAPPSQDRQELPHSVVLEFLSGGCLQIAAEDWRGQAGVLTRLGDAHRAWMYAS